MTPFCTSMGMGLVLVTFTGKGMEAGGKGRRKEAAGMILGYKQGRMANATVWFFSQVTAWPR